MHNTSPIPFLSPDPHPDTDTNTHTDTSPTEHRAPTRGTAVPYRWLARAGILALLLVPQLVVPLLVPEVPLGSRALADLTILPAIGAGALLLYYYWRLTGRAGAAWVATAGLLAATHLLAVLPVREALGLPTGPAMLAELVLLATLAAVAGWPRGREPAVDPAVLGLGLGVLLTLVVALFRVVAGAVAWTPAAGYALLAAELLVGALLAASLLRATTLPPALRVPLAGGALLLFLARAVAQVPGDLSGVVSLLLAAVATGGAVLCLTVGLEQLTSEIGQQRGALADLRDRLAELEGDAHLDHEKMHEVRATVAGLAAAHEVLRSGATGGGPPATRLQAMVAEEVERLLRLLQGEHDRRPQWFDLGAALDAVVLAHRLRGTRITWGGAQQAGHEVFAPRDDVVEAVNILLDNAARHAPGADVQITVESTAGEVLLTVADAGPGIPPALVEAVFERGVRGTDSPGTGTGLPRARHVARRAGGDLQLEPGRSRGAGFRLDLPASPVLYSGAGRPDDVLVAP